MTGILPFIEFRNLILIITGQAISSVLISLIRVITFFAFANLNKEQIYFFSLLATFAFALLIILLTFIVLYFLKNRADFYICFKKLDKKHTTGLFDSDVLLDCNEKEINGETPDKPVQTKKTHFQLIKLSLRQNKFFYANVVFFSCITYLFHPVIFINMNLFTNDKQLSIILTIILFNVCDSIGRLSTNFFFVKKKRSLYILNSLRIYFIVVFVLINIWIASKPSEISSFIGDSNAENNNNILSSMKSVFTNEIFILINIALFSFSYGFINCNSFILLGGIKDEIIQFKSGFITSICIGCGVFMGSSLSNFI